MSSPELPEYLCCSDPESPQFGAVAVRLPEGSPFGDYGVMTLRNGGDFRRAEQLEGWTPLDTKKTRAKK